MNKNIIIIAIVAGLLAIGAGGLAVWSASQNNQGAEQNTTPTTDATTDQNAVVATEPGTPDTQTDSVAAPYISTVVVKGAVNPNGAMTTYWYEYGKTVALGLKTPNYVIGSGFVKMYTPAYILGLESNTDYYFRLSANNAFGTNNGVTYTFRTNTTPPPPQGTAPTTTTIAANSIERTTTDVHGKINPNGAQSNFWFEYGTSLQLGSVTSFESSNNSNSTEDVSISLSNLQPLTKYYFRLNAQNQFGTVNGQILTFTTKGPAQTSAPTITTNLPTAITSSSIKFNADINPRGTQTTYWFEYSSSSLLSGDILLNTPEQSLQSNTLVTSVSATINGLNHNTTYFFRAIAKNQYGTSSGQIRSVTTKK